MFVVCLMAFFSSFVFCIGKVSLVCCTGPGLLFTFSRASDLS